MDNDTARNKPSAIVWQSRQVWGAVGLTHYAEVMIGDDTYRFTLDQPTRGQWTARGWVNGSFCMYRDHTFARSLRGMKDVVARYVGDLRTQAAGK